jgi:hypothetical protein
MAETFSIDCASVVKPASRPRSRKPAAVSASALAQHLDCSRTYIGRLEAEGVIQRQGDGFPLDQTPSFAVCVWMERGHMSLERKKVVTV